MKKLNKITHSLQIDIRLLSKEELNSNQKVILAYIMGYLTNNDKFYATNAHINKATGISTKTISNSITLFFTMGIISIETTPSNHRHIYLTLDNINKYNDWLGTIEEHQNMMEMKKERKPETPTKPAVETQKQAPQPAPKNEAVKQPKPQLTFDEVFGNEDDDDEPITIKKIDRNKIKEAEELEKAEEMEALKFAEDSIDKMNNINEDEQCLLNIITNEDGGVFFDLTVLPVNDIINYYNDQLTDNLQDSTIFLNIVNQLINKDKIEKIVGEDFSTYLVIYGIKKDEEEVAEMEKELV